MTGVSRPGEVGAVPIPADAVGPPPEPDPPPRPRPLSWRGLLLVAALAAVGTVLDGPTGIVVGVIVVAVLLAGVTRRAIGAAGVLALVATPIAVVVNGIPAPDEVSPVFVVGSLWPHHLTFAGLSLVGTWVVLDVVDHLRAAPPVRPEAAETETARQPIERFGRTARFVAVTVVALAALVALIAVSTQ